MPTKINRAGKQQPYVPAGNGDASGEYGTHATGGNIHYKASEGSGSEGKDISIKTDNSIPTPAEKKNLESKGINVITEEMKTKQYTEKFASNVNISRTSINNEEIGVFNAYLENVFNNYPKMDKFTTITVKNNTKSYCGGFIRTKLYYSGKKEIELYINSGWLDKSPYKDKIKELEGNVGFYNSLLNNAYERKAMVERDSDNIALENINTSIERYKNEIKKGQDEINRLKSTPKEEWFKSVGNVIDKIEGRNERLKALMSHEMMHRITNDVKSAQSNPELGIQATRLWQDVNDAYKKAINNGDINKISRYAKTSADEFLSEANTMLEFNMQMPDYITSVLKRVKEFNRGEI